MVNPIQRVRSDPRMGWSTFDSSFAHEQQSKRPQSLLGGLDFYVGAIGSDLNNTSNAYNSQLSMNGIQTSLDGITNEGVDYPGCNYLVPVDWNLPYTGSHYLHGTGSQPDVPHLDFGSPRFGATSQQEINGAFGTTFPFSVSNAEFAQNMDPFSNSWPLAIAQPQLGNEEPYSDQVLSAQPTPSARDDVDISIPTRHDFGDVFPVGPLPRFETPRNTKSPHRTWSSPVPTQGAKPAWNQGKDCQGPMIQTLNMHMDPTEPRKRRCFSSSEKERINQVRKEGACATCRKKHRKCWHAALNPEESHATSPDSNGPETPFSDSTEDVQIFSLFGCDI